MSLTEIQTKRNALLDELDELNALTSSEISEKTTVKFQIVALKREVLNDMANTQFALELGEYNEQIND